MGLLPWTHKKRCIILGLLCFLSYILSIFVLGNYQLLFWNQLIENSTPIGRLGHEHFVESTSRFAEISPPKLPEETHRPSIISSTVIHPENEFTEPSREENVSSAQTNVVPEDKELGTLSQEQVDQFKSSPSPSHGQKNLSSTKPASEIAFQNVTKHKTDATKEDSANKSVSETESQNVKGRANASQKLSPISADVPSNISLDLKKHQPPRKPIPSDDELVEQMILSGKKEIEKEIMATPERMHLKSHVPAAGGQPVRILIAANWRSGSTFMGDILLSHPATYYHYEPFLDYGIHQIRNDSLGATKAVGRVKDFFTCNYSNSGDYLVNALTNDEYFGHNKRLFKKHCDMGIGRKRFCFRPKVLNPFCQLFPIQYMKTVRLRGNLLRPLLEDKRLNLNVVLLIRDPRGTLQSRKHREWCPDNPECADPKILCKDLEQDYWSAQELRKLFPETFRVIRFEEFAVEPYKNAKTFLNSFGLNLEPEVMQFLDTHTKEKQGGEWSTYRNSKTAPFHWVHDLTFQEIQDIQSGCADALKLWGYKAITDQEQQMDKTFHPVLDLNWGHKL